MYRHSHINLDQISNASEDAHALTNAPTVRINWKWGRLNYILLLGCTIAKRRISSSNSIRHAHKFFRGAMDAKGS